MLKINQKGVLDPRLFIAIVGIVILLFVVFTNSASFQNGLFGYLYPKPPAEAQGPKPTASAATLLVTPNPASPSSSIRVTGTGFSCTTWVEIRVIDPNGQVVIDNTTSVWCDGGTISVPFTAPASTGTYTVNAYQNQGKGRKTTLTQVAQTTLVIQ